MGDEILSPSRKPKSSLLVSALDISQLRFKTSTMTYYAGHKHTDHADLMQLRVE